MRVSLRPGRTAAPFLAACFLASCSGATPGVNVNPSVAPSVGIVSPVPSLPASTTPTASPSRSPGPTASPPCFLGFLCGSPSPSPTASPTASPTSGPTASPTPTPAPTSAPGFTLAPTSLAFLSTGVTTSFTVDQVGFSGSFTASACLQGAKTVATVTPASSMRTFSVTSVAGGNCTITVTGQGQQSAFLPVQVTTTTLAVD